MRIDGYRFLVQAADRLGPWVFNLAARIIAVGYFLLSRRTGESRRFYAVLFPGRSRLYHRWCTFRQYQNFTTIHLDRLLANRGRVVQVSITGEERLNAAIGGSGAILLMSHLGNWEMAARLLMRQRRDLRLLLYMGVKEQEGVEGTQKEELRRAGVTIIGVDRGGSSPFAAVDGIRLLQAGGLVSMTGDVLWRPDQRRLPVTLCGRRAWVAEAPFVFALVSGAPIYVFFAFRRGERRYDLVLSEAITVRAASRAERGAAVAEAARRYAALLEAALRAHPFEWYHFDRFLHEPVEAESPPG